MYFVGFDELVVECVVLGLCVVFLCEGLFVYVVCGMCVKVFVGL